MTSKAFKKEVYLMERIYIFDTTLRDGEQSPGATMNLQEKKRMARQLERLGVDIIEAGFPAASEGDFKAVQEIARSVQQVQVAGLCRAVEKDIVLAYEAVKHSPEPRIHTFIATSDVHLKYKLKKSRQEVLDITREAVRLAAKLCPNVEFSAEDASRSDWDYLVEVFSVAVESGAKVLNVPDTVGYTQPGEFFELITYLRKHVRGAEKVIFSVHCHNDLGLAVANTLAALKAGAKQAEVTVSGIGERAGNAALEEVIMNLTVRKEYYNFVTNVQTEQIYPTCRLLSLIIGQPIPPYKAIVGANAFAHESGIHQDGVLKNRLTYEIMTPQSVGKTSSDIVLGKHSGRHAIKQKLQELGYNLGEEELNKVFLAVKNLADKKKKIYDEDVEAIVLEEVYRLPDKFELKYLSAISGNMAIPTAVLKMQVNGEEKKLADFGVGPIDAIFNTISRIVDRKPKLLRYSVNAITGGTDAQGEVTVRVEENNLTAVGRASDPDIIVASAKAYINALNRLVKKEEEQTNGQNS
ncbi:MAG: 2-isopropylmalate synthase [Desulfonauticus sp.]|nr:2-isopropylmalate synthase [Desulfonauticus sp.]